MNQLPNSFEQMTESKYMKKDDVEEPKLLTIANFTRENVAQQGEEPEYKWTVHWMEQGMRPLVLNATNLQLMKLALGVNGPAEAIGHQIVAYNDPTVSFGGKLTGGVRLRAPRTKKPAPPVQAQGIDDSDIPF